VRNPTRDQELRGLARVDPDKIGQTLGNPNPLRQDSHRTRTQDRDGAELQRAENRQRLETLRCGRTAEMETEGQ